MSDSQPHPEHPGAPAYLICRHHWLITQDPAPTGHCTCCGATARFSPSLQVIEITAALDQPEAAG